jgi:hypothetical protein
MVMMLRFDQSGRYRTTMKLRVLGLPLVLALAAAGCSDSSSPAGATTVTVASAVAPANGAVIPNVSQPVTLTVSDAVVTDPSASVTYTFEVATDAGFTSKVSTKDVPQTSGRTSVTLDTLAPGRDYYWHVRTSAADTVGVFSNALKFSIGPALGAPGLASPADGAVTSPWPTLITNNAVRSGPVVGPVVYRFEVSTSNTFNATVVSATVPEAAGQTSLVIPSNTPPPSQATQYFWRVTAIDQSTSTASAASVTRSFTVDPFQTRQARLAAQLGIPLWPGIQPTGANGKAIMGDNWEVQIMTSFGGTKFQAPRQEWLQLFDLMDRGFSPQGAIDWMHGNGYPTEAAWFPSVQVIGVEYVYLALVNGRWDVVLRAE